MLFSGEPTRVPRWVNLDDRRARDIKTGLIIHLTCDDRHPPAIRNACAMEVVDALNRIYDEPE